MTINTEDFLIDELAHWQTAQGLPLQCAEEQLRTCANLNAYQRQYLRCYCRRWDANVALAG